MTRNENLLFGSHFETVHIFLFWNMAVNSVSICGVEIIKIFGGKVVFHGTPPYALTWKVGVPYAVKC